MIFNFSFLNTIFNDAPHPWQIGFQDSAAPGFTGIVELHNTIFFYLVVISVGVFWVLTSIIYYYNSSKSAIVHKYLNHGTLIELIWTITPAFILIAIAFPSFRLLYLLDEVISPTITIKVVGHQWYWSYEYSDYVNDSGDSIEFDSYMIPESDLELGLNVLELHYCSLPAFFYSIKALPKKAYLASKEGLGIFKINKVNSLNNNLPQDSPMQSDYLYNYSNPSTSSIQGIKSIPSSEYSIASSSNSTNSTTVTDFFTSSDSGSSISNYSLLSNNSSILEFGVGEMIPTRLIRGILEHNYYLDLLQLNPEYLAFLPYYYTL